MANKQDKHNTKKSRQMDNDQDGENDEKLKFDPSEIPQDPSIDYLGSKLFQPDYKQRVVNHLKNNKISKTLNSEH